MNEMKLLIFQVFGHTWNSEEIIEHREICNSCGDCNKMFDTTEYLEKTYWWTWKIKYWKCWMYFLWKKHLKVIIECTIIGTKSMKINSKNGEENVKKN